MATFGIAGELASLCSDVKGPTSFKVAFFDEIYNLSSEKLNMGK